MKKKRKHHNAEKIAKNFLIGSSYHFEVEDPLTDYPEIKNTFYSHKNPVKAVMMERSLSGIRKLFEITPLKWRASVEVKFKTGCECYSRVAEIVWFGMLIDCGAEYQETLESIFAKSNMDHYDTCSIKVEVIGINELKESDFSISKAESV